MRITNYVKELQKEKSTILNWYSSLNQKRKDFILNEFNEISKESIKDIHNMKFINFLKNIYTHEWKI